MSSTEFEAAVEKLIKQQGGEDFILAALAEFGSQYVDEVPNNAQAFVLGRCAALWEESL